MTVVFRDETLFSTARWGPSPADMIAVRSCWPGTSLGRIHVCDVEVATSSPSFWVDTLQVRVGALRSQDLVTKPWTRHGRADCREKTFRAGQAYPWRVPGCSKVASRRRS